MTEPITVQVTVNLDQALSRRRRVVTYTSDGPYEEHYDEPATLEDLVLDGVIAALIEQATQDKSMWTGLTHRIGQIRDELLAKLLEPILADALTRAIQPTNRMGEGVCEATTLTDLIAAKGEAWLGESVSTSRGGRQTRITQIINEALDRTLTAELRGALDKGKAQIKDALTNHAATLLADTLARQADAAKG